MRKSYKLCMMLLLFGFLCMLPNSIHAADKKKEQEFDFNSNKTVTVSEDKSYAQTEKYTWLKYKAAADGYLTVEVLDPDGAYENAKGYLALYNSSKTSLLSSSSIFYNTANREKSIWYKFTFGMLKGQEYFIRVRSENAVGLTRSFTKVKDVSGPTRIKAAKLKKNKLRTGLIPAGVTNADWYLIELTKKQNLRLYYSAKTNGSFKLSFYMGAKRIASRNIYQTAEQQKLVLRLKKTSGKQSGMNPGKYYIKIERANSTSSGFYKIKWN